MYINPFWAGVLVTVLAEVMLLIASVIISMYKAGKK